MSERRKLKKGDILLLLLYVDNCSAIRGRTRLQKMAFVFERELLKKYDFDKKLEKKTLSNFEFEPHNYGPFSKKVSELMDFFVNIEMVKVNYSEDKEEVFDNIDDTDITFDDVSEAMFDLEDESVYENIPAGEPIYTLTDKGKGYVTERLLGFLNNDQIEALTQLKRTFNKYSLIKILKYIYTKYPEMAKKSLIKETIQETTWPF